MNHREKMFKAKFADAGRHLDVMPDNVISLKLRDNVTSYREYQDLLQVLEREAGIEWHEADGNLQGRGYLVGDAKSKVIVVEHETGLEILYIAGSIASLVGLVPLILQCWGNIRGHGGRPRPRIFRSVEIRRFDRDGQLNEDRAHGIAAPVSEPLSLVNTALTSAAEVIDAEIRALRGDVKDLTARLRSLEKKVANKKATKKKAKKKSSKKRG